MADDQVTRDGSEPHSEVPEERVRRRRFSLPRKLAILAAVERCATAEQVVALLAKEGLHSSHLTVWRKQFEKSKAQVKEPSKRTKRATEFSRTIGQLEQEKAELQRQLTLARQLLELPRASARTPSTLPVVAPQDPEELVRPMSRYGTGR